MNFFPVGGRLVRQTRPHNCVQTVIAIGLGVTVEFVERSAGTTGTMRIQGAMDLLRELRISSGRPVAASHAAAFWPFYYRQNGGRRMRGLGFVLPASEGDVGHAYFLYGRRMFDPATGRTMRLRDSSVRRHLDCIVFLPRA